MATKTKLMKSLWHPRPHDSEGSLSFELDDATIDTTILPIAMYDEGLGAPSAYEANPQHASFVVTDDPNCFVESRVDRVFCRLKWGITSKFIDDNIPAVRCFYMPLFLAFKEDYIAVDELSNLKIQDTLELQTEATDRQGYPLYNGTDMTDKFGSSAHVGLNVPGLTADSGLEGITFTLNQYYDMLHYLRNSGKLKSVQGGIKWFTLTPNKPVATIDIRIRSSVKRMNEYTFFGVMIGCPVVDTADQIPVTADITAATRYVFCDWQIRFNEWNEDFYMKMV